MDFLNINLDYANTIKARVQSDSRREIKIIRVLKIIFKHNKTKDMVNANPKNTVFIAIPLMRLIFIHWYFEHNTVRN